MKKWFRNQCMEFSDDLVPISELSTQTMVIDRYGLFKLNTHIQPMDEESSWLMYILGDILLFQGLARFRKKTSPGPLLPESQASM